MRGLQDEPPRTMTLREAADLCGLKLSALRSCADSGSLEVALRDGERTLRARSPVVRARRKRA